MLSNTEKYGYVKNELANDLEAIARGIYDPSVDPKRAIKLLNEAEAIRSKKQDWTPPAEFLGLLGVCILWELASHLLQSSLHQPGRFLLVMMMFFCAGLNCLFGRGFYSPSPIPETYNNFYQSQMSRYRNEIQKENDRHVQERTLLWNKMIIIDHFEQEYKRMPLSKFPVEDRETIADLKRDSKLIQEAIDQEISDHTQKIADIRNNYFFTT
ncbi:MAG: hypothetical protein EOP04_07045 [Proteobacteria bacterium]|nr:MAG: hypothetical protein EOP04_07045 [Pseudomonadota bacterium]